MEMEATAKQIINLQHKMSKECRWQLLLALLAQIGTVQREITNLNQQRENDWGIQRQQFQQMNQSLRRLAINPLRQLHQAQPPPAGGGGAGGGAAATAASTDGPPSDVSPTPRTLYVLWE